MHPADTGVQDWAAGYCVNSTTTQQCFGVGNSFFLSFFITKSEYSDQMDGFAHSKIMMVQYGAITARSRKTVQLAGMHLPFQPSALGY